MVSAKKWRKISEVRRKTTERKWNGARFVGKSPAKKSKRGLWYVTVYRKKGPHKGSFNIWYGKKKPNFRVITQIPEGASEAVLAKIKKHNMICRCPLKRESPFKKK